VVELTDANCDEVLRQEALVLVEFWAPWCGPCRQLEPTLRALAAHFANKIVFRRVNADENPDLCVRFGVHAIPTLLFFRAGTPVQRSVGLRSEGELSGLLYQLLDV